MIPGICRRLSADGGRPTRTEFCLYPRIPFRVDAAELGQSACGWINVREMVDYAENNNGEDSRNPFIKLKYSYTENKNVYGNITGYNISILITNNGVTINDISEYANQ